MDRILWLESLCEAFRDGLTDRQFAEYMEEIERWKFWPGCEEEAFAEIRHRLKIRFRKLPSICDLDDAMREVRAEIGDREATKQLLRKQREWEETAVPMPEEFKSVTQ